MAKYRPSIYIVIFLISFNAGAIMLETTGTAGYLGIDTELGDTGELDSAQSETSFQSGTGRGSTLFGTYNRITTFLNDIFNAIMPGAEMLKNAGVPPEPVNFFFAFLAIIPPIDLALFLRGM